MKKQKQHIEALSKDREGMLLIINKLLRRQKKSIFPKAVLDNVYYFHPVTKEEFGGRIFNVLSAVKVTCIGMLCEYKPSELLKFAGNESGQKIGKKSLGVIEKILKENYGGLTLTSE